MAIINITNNGKCWLGFREKEPLCTVGGSVNTMEGSMKIPQKTKNNCHVIH
jgi:hypothetical protein